VRRQPVSMNTPSGTAGFTYRSAWFWTLVVILPASVTMVAGLNEDGSNVQ
jgi:hypothetical protein